MHAPTIASKFEVAIGPLPVLGHIPWYFRIKPTTCRLCWLGVLLLSLSCDRVLLAVSQYLTCSLVFPIGALLHGPVEGDSPRKRAIINTTAAIPALVRVEDNRWLTLDWIRNIYVHLAHLHAIVAAATNFGVKSYRLARCGHIGHSIYRFFRHGKLLISVDKHLCSLYYGPCNWLSYCPNRLETVPRPRPFRSPA